MKSQAAKSDFLTDEEIWRRERDRAEERFLTLLRSGDPDARRIAEAVARKGKLTPEQKTALHEIGGVPW